MASERSAPERVRGMNGPPSEATGHDFKLPEIPPITLSFDEATAIVSAAFDEDHDAPTFDAAIKRLGDWVDFSLKLSAGQPSLGREEQPGKWTGPADIAWCPEHGLHGARDTCFECGKPVEQIRMIPLAEQADGDQVTDEMVDALRRVLDGQQLKWLAVSPAGRKAISRAALEAALSTTQPVADQSTPGSSEQGGDR